MGRIFKNTLACYIAWSVVICFILLAFDSDYWEGGFFMAAIALVLVGVMFGTCIYWLVRGISKILKGVKEPTRKIVSESSEAIKEVHAKAKVKAEKNKKRLEAEEEKERQARYPQEQNDDSSYRKLEELASLKEKDILSEEEFLAEKKKILGQKNIVEISNKNRIVPEEGRIECPYCHAFVKPGNRVWKITDHLIVWVGLFCFVVPAIIYTLWLGSRIQCPSCAMSLK